MSTQQDYMYLSVNRHGPVLNLELNRPDRRNAINPEMIAELTRAFSLDATDLPRVVVLSGCGGWFCSGADTEWMRSTAALTPDQNLADAQALATMLEAVDSCAVPVVARVDGGAFGGGLGLLCCCDSVIAAADCRFSFSEVRLGLSPTTIAPYVIAKIGAAATRDLFLSGSQFDSQRALQIGLVQEVASGDLDAAVKSKVAELLKGGPLAQAATKRLVKILAGDVAADVMLVTAKLIAELRASPEGQEGLLAFSEKRVPDWAAPPAADPSQSS